MVLSLHPGAVAELDGTRDWEGVMTCRDAGRRCSREGVGPTGWGLDSKKVGSEIPFSQPFSSCCCSCEMFFRLPVHNCTNRNSAVSFLFWPHCVACRILAP